MNRETDSVRFIAARPNTKKGLVMNPLPALAVCAACILPHALSGASFQASVGRIFSEPHEFTIALRAKSAGPWQGTLVQQMGAGDCGFALDIAQNKGENEPHLRLRGVWTLGDQPDKNVPNRMPAASALPQDEWTSLVLIASQKERRLELFIDGKIAMRAVPGEVVPWPTLRPFCIGSNEWGGNAFQGEIETVALWDRALSAQELKKLNPETASHAWTIKEERIRTIAGDMDMTRIQPGPRVTGCEKGPKEPLSLWYRRVPRQWTDMIPLGNGHNGVMISGNPEREIILFNDDTLWAGGPYDHLNPNANPKALQDIRQAVFSGNQGWANRIANDSFLSRPLKEMPYSLAGALQIDQNTGGGDISDYLCMLDLTTAVATTSFRRDGVSYVREAFASCPDRVAAFRLSADKPGKISFRATLGTPQDFSKVFVRKNEIILVGKAIDCRGVEGKTKFELRARILLDDGKLIPDKRGLRVEGANSATILLASATSYVNAEDVSASPAERIQAIFKPLKRATFDSMKKRHVADYQKLFNRVSIDLGGGSDLPTDDRLSERLQRGNQLDPALAALYFQYGRYLLIASSRPGSQPANLQGVWTEETQVPWDSKYTININTQMNYWPAETTNLSECHEPLFRMIEEMVPFGRKTAQRLYGAKGWVAHHNTDLWRQCGPIDLTPTGMWPMGSAWLCLHFRDRWQFRRDKRELERFYPVVKESVRFYLDFLIPDAKNPDLLVTNPSYSPEQGGLCAAPTMDVGILKALFAFAIEASEILGDDPAFRAQVRKTADRLPPFRVGSWGQLREWMDEHPLDNPDNKHRHVSHLFAVFPGNVIRASDEELFAAARKSLDARGDEATGWSMGWKINLWARFKDGNRAWRLLSNLIHPSRTYGNLFDAHPPFQIDGNFGGVSGIAEMLLQSHETTEKGTTIVDLLPALPDAIPQGRVSGLKARGGATVSMEWKDKEPVRAELSDLKGRPLLVRWNGKTVNLTGKKGRVVLTKSDFR